MIAAGPESIACDDARATESHVPGMYFGMYFGMYLAMYLACTVSHVPGEDRRVEMACILIAHACNLSECMPNACNLSESSESC